MYTLTKEYSFIASHQLSDGHRHPSCEEENPAMPLETPRGHRHGYHISVEFNTRTLTDDGWVIDHNKLRAINKFIINEVHDRHLNDIMDTPPTPGALAEWLYIRIRNLFSPPELYKIKAVTVRQTPYVSVRYECKE